MRLFRYAKYGPFSGENTCRAAASAMAVVEVNAAMGQIVAAPTAGASGILPGVLLECGISRGWTDEQLIQGLFCAGAVGLLFAEKCGSICTDRCFVKSITSYANSTPERPTRVVTSPFANLPAIPDAVNIS